ncbi:MAG: hypothetical protein RBU37_09415 [Myxococcota bacterium]|jgi:hypothetical protein|nr:hypothetical protein [Myxococcota bacterium]
MPSLLTFAHCLIALSPLFSGLACSPQHREENRAAALPQATERDQETNALSALETLEEQARNELGPEFSFRRVEDRYLVASDASTQTLERCLQTITRVHEALYAEFLTTQREAPLLILLFRDTASYDTYNLRHYGEPAGTPYGFYDSSESTLVMNIATGTGTLAHEQAHPLLEADFASIPSWFNEGMASLFEQSTFTDGKIRGLVNRRLEGLHEVLARGEAGLLARVMKTSTDDFYGPDSGEHYAVARYLCLYLQDLGLLAEYYRHFHAHFDADPSGIASLEQITGLALDEFEKAWKDWSAELRFEG